MFRRRLIQVFMLGITWTSALATNPREPLTFRNTGLYGGFNENTMSKDSPFDFLIVGAAVLEDGVPAELGQPWSEQGPKWNKLLHEARRNGKRVIADVSGYVLTEDGRAISFHQGDEHDVTPDRFMRLFDQFFAAVDEEELYAITISEENIFWYGHQERLEYAYAYLKERYDVPLYQWWSPSGETDTTPGLMWPNIPADGWGVDDYFHAQPLFERAMRGYIVLQKPMFQIIWAAPDHPSVPWSPKTFWEQYDVCRKYNIPMAFFTWVGRNDTPHSNTFGWDPRTSPTNRHVFEQYCIYGTQLAKRLPTVPLTEWDFVPWAPKVNELKIDPDQPGKADYNETFAKERHVMAWEDATVQGFAHLRWDSSPIQLCPRQTGQAQASLRYLFDSPGKPARITATVTGATPGGTVELQLESTNGHVLAEATMSGGQARVTWEASDAAATRFAVTCRLRGVADQAGEVLAELASIDVSVELIE